MPYFLNLSSNFVNGKKTIEILSVEKLEFQARLFVYLFLKAELARSRIKNNHMLELKLTHEYTISIDL
ncbi:MAG: hypothetical protein ACTSQS_16685 [Promethearchaeota archaeon]